VLLTWTLLSFSTNNVLNGSARTAGSSIAERSGKERDPEATHRSILSAARALMAKQGPEALSVSAVARLAGVNRTTAYQHFRSREELVGAALAEVSDEVGRMLKADMPLDRRIDHILGYLLHRPEIARLWMFQMLADFPLVDRRGRDRFDRAMHAFARSPLAKKGIDPEMLGQIVMAAMLVWSLDVRTRLSKRIDGRSATLRFTRELKRLLLYGAVNPRQAPDLVKSVAGRGLLHFNPDQNLSESR